MRLPGAARHADPSRAVAGHENGIDLHATLVLPHRLAAHGLGWLATASRGVRLHTSEATDRTARHLGADAFTVGEAIVVRQNRLAPATPRGVALLAHELVHVDQHRRTGGRALPASDPAGHDQELEALAVERQVLELLQPRGRSAAPARASEGAGWATPGRLSLSDRPSAVLSRAAEDRPVERAVVSAPSADPEDVADRVYQMLRRRLSVERERFLLGRG
jgi:hypothetical protein